jgi:hypothetical protein
MPRNQRAERRNGFLVAIPLPPIARKTSPIITNRQGNITFRAKLMVTSHLCS